MSFKGRAEFAARPPTMVVQQPTTENYYDLLVTQRFYLYGINSLVVALIAATIAVSVGTLAAYALSRFRLPRNFNYHLLFTMLTVRMFPPIVTVIPLFVFYNREILRLQAVRHPARSRADPCLHGAAARDLDDDRLLPRYPARHGGGGAGRRRQPLRRAAQDRHSAGGARAGGDLHPRLHLVLERVPAGADPDRTHGRRRCRSRSPARSLSTTSSAAT